MQVKRLAVTRRIRFSSRPCILRSERHILSLTLILSSLDDFHSSFLSFLPPWPNSLALVDARYLEKAILSK